MIDEGQVANRKNNPTAGNGEPSFAQQHCHLAKGGRYCPRWFRATPFWQGLPGDHRAVLDHLYQSVTHEDTTHNVSGLTVRRGEWLWTYATLGKAAGATMKQARTAIAKAKAAGVIATADAYFTAAGTTTRLLRVRWLDFDLYEWPDKTPSAGRPRRPVLGRNGQTETGQKSDTRADHRCAENAVNNRTSSPARPGSGQTTGQSIGQTTGQTTGQHDEPPLKPKPRNPQRETLSETESGGLPFSRDSDSDSDVHTQRRKARLRWRMEASRLFAPRASAQYHADDTSACNLFDEYLWPEDAPEPEGRDRYEKAMALIAKASTRPKKMAWLTKCIKNPRNFNAKGAP